MDFLIEEGVITDRESNLKQSKVEEFMEKVVVANANTALAKKY